MIWIVLKIILIESGRDGFSRQEEVSVAASEESSILLLCPMYSGRETETLEWERKELSFVQLTLSWRGMCSRKEDRHWD